MELSQDIWVFFFDSFSKIPANKVDVFDIVYWQVTLR